MYEPFAADQTEEVQLQFNGPLSGFIGNSLLLALSGALLIPFSWGLARYCRWFADNVSFSDGSTVEFFGKGSERWYLLPLLLLGSIAVLLVIAVVLSVAFPDDAEFTSQFVGTFFFPIIQALGTILFFRWIASKTALNNSEILRFDGNVFTLFMILLIVALPGFAIHFIPQNDALALLILIVCSFVLFSLYPWIYTRFIINSLANDNACFHFTGKPMSFIWRNCVLYTVPVLIAFLICLPLALLGKALLSTPPEWFPIAFGVLGGVIAFISYFRMALWMLRWIVRQTVLVREKEFSFGR